VRLPIGKFLQAPVILRGPEVDDAFVPEGQAPRRGAGGQEQPVIGVGAALVIQHLFCAGIELLHPAAAQEIHLRRHFQEDIVQLLAAGPERLGKRRSVVRQFGFGGDHADGPVRIRVAELGDRCLGGHPASDDQVGVVRHVLSPDSRWVRWRSGKRKGRPGGPCERRHAAAVAVLEVFLAGDLMLPAAGSLRKR